MKRFATKAIGRVWRATWRMAFALMAAGITWAAPIAIKAQGQPAILLDVSGPIGPATSEYIEQGLEKAASDMAAVVVLRMDTPGGLDTSMRAIIKAIIASPIPVATFVPSGGRAASAGTYILYASHIAAMAPGTNLGAATPVQIGGGQPVPIPDIDRFKDRIKENEKGKEAPAKVEKSPGMKEKIVNDAVAYIRSLAKMHGRNEDWAARAVTEAASLPAEEALKLGVIDVIAVNVEDLIAKIDGRTVMVRGKAQVVQSAGTALQPHAPDWRIEFLSIITNPNVAYILLLIGLYGLIFEFYNPGLIVPGVIGGISLLLGLYALQLLPINYAGRCRNFRAQFRRAWDRRYRRVCDRLHHIAGYGYAWLRRILAPCRRALRRQRRDHAADRVVARAVAPARGCVGARGDDRQHRNGRRLVGEYRKGPRSRRNLARPGRPDAGSGTFGQGHRNRWLDAHSRA
jgi:membrane-bound ClpP family serine protease